MELQELCLLLSSIANELTVNTSNSSDNCEIYEINLHETYLNELPSTSATYTATRYENEYVN